MYIQNSSTNFTSRFIPTPSLEKAFQKHLTEPNIYARRQFTNSINALLNDGKDDVIELRKVSTPIGTQVRGYINGEDAQAGYRYIRGGIYHTEAECAADVIEALAQKRNSINKLQKFGLRKLRQISDSIFNTKNQ